MGSKMTSHLNIFVPFDRAAASHENQLTRALLVVLRCSPMAHQAWLRVVEPEQKLSDLSKAEFASQRQLVLDPTTQVPEGEAVSGISVWLAPDAVEVNSPIASSDRQQVLDGIVTYGNDLVVVIENKIACSAITDQPRHINLYGSPVNCEKKARSVSWQQLLGVLSDLVERDLVSGAERLLISDLLELVEEHFPRIGPYSTLVKCGEHRFRIERRLDTSQGEVTATSVGEGLGWRDVAGTPKIFMAWLGIAIDNSTVCLRMYPADTLGQPRAFYRDAAAVDSVLALQSDEWQVEPHFHRGFMARGYAWLRTPLSVEKYCAYWINEIRSTREIGRQEWEKYWAKLESADIVEAAGKETFDAEFTPSQRQKAQPRPGVFCEYKWPLVEARRLDAHGKLVEKVRARLNQMLTALRAPLVFANRGAR